MPVGMQAHEIASYATTVVLTVAGICLLVRALTEYPGADPDLRIMLTGYIVAGVVLLLLGISCLGGVGLGRYDNFYDSHPAPWPAAAYLRVPALVIGMIGGIVVHIMNRRRYRDWD